MATGDLDKRQRKAMLGEWKAAQRDKARAAFPLPEASLEQFFEALETRVNACGCAHDTRNAQHVIDAMQLSDAQANALLDWCCEHGGFCDCEIVLNSFGHFNENRAQR